MSDPYPTPRLDLDAIRQRVALARTCYGTHFDEGAREAVAVARDVDRADLLAEVDRLRGALREHSMLKNLDDAQLTWRDAALRVGEQLAASGPDGYYAFTQVEWLKWALQQIPLIDHVPAARLRALVEEMRKTARRPDEKPDKIWGWRVEEWADDLAAVLADPAARSDER